MKIPFVDLQAQYQSIKSEIDQAIHSCLDTNSFVGGEIVKKFEGEFASYIGTRHCIGCANGTDAIELALKALGVGMGDEVIVPALTWIATAGAVSNVGAEPIFVDVLASEYTIDPAQIEEKISERTRAIIPVHFYGLPARMPEIMTLAKKHDLHVIEDCAQAVGASIDGQKVGTFGDAGTFSFYPGKNLGAYGDGGAVVTNAPAMVEKVQRLGNHGQLHKHSHGLIGRNSRLDTLQAAVLSVKLGHLEEWTRKRIEIAQRYSAELEGVVTPAVPDGYRHVYHVYAILRERRDALMDKMKQAEVGCAIHYPNPVPLTDAYSYQGLTEPHFPIARKITSRQLSLPMYAEMGIGNVDMMKKIINA